MEAADIYMVLWDEKFLDKLRKLGIRWEDYKKYVNDIETTMMAIEFGWEYDESRDRMVYNQGIVRRQGGGK